jgi:predicted aspartyl protease
MHDTIAIYGPKGVVERSALVDTGAKYTVVRSADAVALGLEMGSDVPVITNGGTVVWHASHAFVSAGGLQPVDVPVWIAPDGVETALGETTMAALGYKLVRPPPQYDEVPGVAAVASAAQMGVPAPNLPRPNEFLYAARQAVCQGCEFSDGTGVPCSLCRCSLEKRMAAGCPIGRF